MKPAQACSSSSSMQRVPNSIRASTKPSQHPSSEGLKHAPAGREWRAGRPLAGSSCPCPCRLRTPWPLRRTCAPPPRLSPLASGEHQDGSLAAGPLTLGCTATWSMALQSTAGGRPVQEPQTSTNSQKGTGRCVQNSQSFHVPGQALSSSCCAQAEGT